MRSPLGEIDVGHGNRGRAARGFVDQRHFAEQIVFAELIEQALTRSDVDPTLPDDEQFLSRVALVEDRLAGGERAFRYSEPRQYAQVEPVISHVV